MNGTCFLDAFLVKIEPYFFEGDILGSNFFLMTNYYQKFS